VSIDARFRQPDPGTEIAALILPGGERVPLSNEVVSVGRSSDCTIVLGDQNASRRHAEFRPVEGGFAIVDLASTNGTKVNGRNVTEHTLVHGDEVLFGATAIRFEKD
jgi:pSer/pThr/pTyr-binding forkhead associated (FHA) protein